MKLGVGPIRECDDLANRLDQINPLVIDYFLEQNQTLQSIGKLMIAWVILEREANHFETSKNYNRPQPSNAKDDWVRFILHALLDNCKSIDHLCKNKVTFITFNYDISLERNLYTRLCAIDLFRGRRSAYRDS